jgi:hypothetical protein
MQFIKVFRRGGRMESVRRAVAVEVENPLSELYTVEESHRKIVQEVAAYVAERGGGWRRRSTTSCTAVSESSTPYPPSWFNRP